ncbi:MAG: hypothetical protein J6K39_02900 [Clostridia bacterium]|nr:hypothetical protein [Clostridia bacterium]
MSTSMLLGLFDWIGDFFKSLFDLIPKIIYLLVSSFACVLDVLQLFFRKLAGLDVYYVDGKAVSGDLVTNFIGGIIGINLNATDGVTFEYSALTTVFWSFVLFGVIITIVSVFIAIIKSHYSYDDKSAKGPMQYVYTGVKSVINIFAVPIIVMLGLYVSQAILTALDSMTSITSGNVAAMYGKDKTQMLYYIDTARSATGVSDEKTCIFYDIFGFGASIAYGPTSDASRNWTTEHAKQLAYIGSSNQTFSGSLFKVAAFNGNRARLGQMTIDKRFSGSASSGMTLFGNAEDNDELADMIDTAFACNLHLKEFFTLEYEFADIVSMKYFTNFLTIGANSFSKFNVGLVWYYYDLWQYNFIVGFAACIICVTLFINIIMGMIARLFMCIGLFLIAPPMFGLTVLDGGKAAKGWRENFIKQVLMAYGAVVGMNLFMLILPYMNEIDFFNILIADRLAQTLVIIVGLITIKTFIALISGLIGAADANAEGKAISEEVQGTIGKATSMTVGAAKVAGKVGVGAAKAIGHGAKAAGKGVVAGAKGVKAGVQRIGQAVNEKKAANFEKALKQDKVIQAMGKKDLSKLSKQDVQKMAEKEGLSKRDANRLYKESQRVVGYHGNKASKLLGKTQYKNQADELRSGLREKDKNFRTQSDKLSGAKNNVQRGQMIAAERGKLQGSIAKSKQKVHMSMEGAKKWGGSALKSAGTGAKTFGAGVAAGAKESKNFVMDHVLGEKGFIGGAVKPIGSKFGDPAKKRKEDAKEAKSKSDAATAKAEDDAIEKKRHEEDMKVSQEILKELKELRKNNKP